MHRYSGWKSLFPKSLQEHPSIAALFRLALDMMNQAMSGQPISRNYTEYLSSLGSRAASSSSLEGSSSSSLATPPSSSPAPSARSAPSRITLSFKDVVERFAEENGYLFLPKGNLRHEGRQLYSFGGVTVFLDRDLLHVQRAGGAWVPASLDEVLQQVKTGRAKP